MEQQIKKFYEAFAALDGAGMASCYHDEIVFEDPAFGKLRGEKAKNMWKMLCESQKGKGFKVEASAIRMEGSQGRAHWEARYTFSQTGKKVHNIIEAEFEFQDGKIIRHTDRFNLYRWARQALGFQGILLGWTPLFKNKLQAQTNRMLTKFEQKNP
jgi:ketosteroid isomerase-like protein